MGMFLYRLHIYNGTFLMMMKHIVSAVIPVLLTEHMQYMVHMSHVYITAELLKSIKLWDLWFPWWWVWKWLSSRTQDHVVWYILTAIFRMWKFKMDRTPHGVPVSWLTSKLYWFFALILFPPKDVTRFSLCTDYVKTQLRKAMWKGVNMTEQLMVEHSNETSVLHKQHLLTS
jgi:hypothetical protein